MILRRIIVLLALLTLFVTSAGGYALYLSLKRSALAETHRSAEVLTNRLANRVNDILAHHQKSVRVLAENLGLLGALTLNNKSSLEKANNILDIFNAELEADVCYLMDSRGMTIASSNRGSSLSFVGENYAFRPYFASAVAGETGVYMALGVTSGKRGIYLSHPVYAAGAPGPIGVAVIKLSIDEINKEMDEAYEGIMNIVGPHGVVFVSNRSEWLFKALWKISPGVTEDIRETKQFGDGPWLWSGMERQADYQAVDGAGNEYHLHTSEIERYPGWSVVYLHDHRETAKRISDPLIRTAKYVIYFLCLFMGLSVYLLYKKANEEINARQTLENKLRDASVTDELTGLYNRRGFLALSTQRYHMANREKKKVCLYYMDLDGLKDINDRFGHAVGDDALRNVADILKQIFRRSDILGRIGGDEFSVLMTCSCLDELKVLQIRIRELLDEFNSREDKPYKLSISIGEIIYDQENPLEFEEFFRQADEKMYKQKKSKKML